MELPRDFNNGIIPVGKIKKISMGRKMYLSIHVVGKYGN